MSNLGNGLNTTHRISGQVQTSVKVSNDLLNDNAQEGHDRQGTVSPEHGAAVGGAAWGRAPSRRAASIRRTAT